MPPHRWGHQGSGHTASAWHGPDPGSGFHAPPLWIQALSPPPSRSEPSPSQVPADTWEQEELGGSRWRQLSAPLCVGLTPASSFRSHSVVMEGPGGDHYWLDKASCLFLSRGGAWPPSCTDLSTRPTSHRPPSQVPVPPRRPGVRWPWAHSWTSLPPAGGQLPGELPPGLCELPRCQSLCFLRFSLWWEGLIH